MDYSITIRPLLLNFNKLQESIIGLITKLNTKTNKYIIAEEKGQGEEINHYQVYLQYKKNTKSSNVRRQIISIINKILKQSHTELSPQELKHGIMVKQIKNNLEGTIGYTLKESNKIHTNIKEEELDNYKSIYEEHAKTNNYDSKNYYRINNKNYHIKTLRYIEETKQEKEEYDEEDIERIIGEMINKQYYWTFLNKRNYLNIERYLLSFLNKTGQDYIQKLRSDSVLLENGY